MTRRAKLSGALLVWCGALLALASWLASCDSLAYAQVRSVTPQTVPGPGQQWMKPAVANSAALPSTGNRLGDCRAAIDTGAVWCLTALPATWSSPSGGGGGSGTVTAATGPAGVITWSGGGTATLTAAVAGPWPTATGLAATPTLCSSGSAPRGVLASGNATGCAAFLPTSTTYAGSASTGGPATTALALNANGTNCSSGSAAAGVDAAGNAEGCTAYVQPTADINSSNQVTATHLGSPLPAAQGGTGQAAVTDSGVPVANGTTFLLKVIPDCQDSTGNHLNYTASTHSFSCGTSSSGGGGGCPVFGGSSDSFGHIYCGGATGGQTWITTAGSDSPGTTKAAAYQAQSGSFASDAPTVKVSDNLVFVGSGGFICFAAGANVGAGVSTETCFVRDAAGGFRVATSASAGYVKLDYLTVAPRSSAPVACASGVEGSIYFNSTSHIHCMCACPLGTCTWTGLGGLTGTC